MAHTTTCPGAVCAELQSAGAQILHDENTVTVAGPRALLLNAVGLERQLATNAAADAMDASLSAQGYWAATS